MTTKILINEKSSKSRDPYVLYLNHFYYYCFSRDDKIYLCVSDNLDTLNEKEETIVYENEEGYKNLWAPELHVINDICYIYVACDDGNNENHRMYVLSNDSSNPLDKYTNRGIIGDISNKWAIDGTVLDYNNELYFIWSGCDKDIRYKQEIFIAKMKNPFELCTKKFLLSTPEYSWEKNGGDGKNLPYVNEGPAVLKIRDKIYLAYSASGCWCKDYCLGLLELKGSNPLLKESWKKYDKPILNNTGGLIGPGHCCFIVEESKNTKKYFIVFHAFNDEKNLDLNNVNARYKEVIVRNDFPILDE